MLICKNEFLKKYFIDEKEFENAKIDWSEIVAIYNDYLPRINDYERVAVFISESLRGAENVHSVKYRVKNPEHLIEKIIRKKSENLRKLLLSIIIKKK